MFVTMKPTRGNSSPLCHSTLATTRRARSQLPARYQKSSYRISGDASAVSPQVAAPGIRIAALCCSAAVLRRRLAAPPGTHGCPAWRIAWVGRLECTGASPGRPVTRDSDRIQYLTAGVRRDPRSPLRTTTQSQSPARSNTLPKGDVDAPKVTAPTMLPPTGLLAD